MTHDRSPDTPATPALTPHEAALGGKPPTHPDITPVQHIIDCCATIRDCVDNPREFSDALITAALRTILKQAQIIVLDKTLLHRRPESLPPDMERSRKAITALETVVAAINAIAANTRLAQDTISDLLK